MQTLKHYSYAYDSKPTESQVQEAVAWVAETFDCKPTPFVHWEQHPQKWKITLFWTDEKRGNEYE